MRPRTTCKLLLTLTVLSVASLSVSAQSNVWSINNESRNAIPADKAVARQSYPKEFKLFNLSIEPLRRQLFSIVDGGHVSPLPTVISLPNADGEYEQFQVFEASNFEPDLQAQFPEIRAYSGKGITDRYATLKMSISPQGIQTMVFRTDKDNEFIEPYSQDHTVYAVFRSQRVKGKLPWTCSTDDKRIAGAISSQLPQVNAPSSNTGELKTMRLAQSCNGEYSNFFGAFDSGQVALVLAAFNATLTRCNGVYEKDLAVHLNLIANTTAVIYYDPANDPYTPYNEGNGIRDWNAQLQAALTERIGEENYDIGHMFGAAGGGGNAGCVGCVCVDGEKGRGITSPADAIPMGDNFDIDYVAHELGHQMGANHTFSHTLESYGVNKEVGAGVTIMGYAGNTSFDPAPHSIDIYHEASIQQIQANLANKTCPVTTVMTANHPPTIAPVNNYTIPITTPFALAGFATDPEGDALTYCWEQDDNATTSEASSVASPTKLTGPNWLSFSPTESPTRIFPKLSTILAGLFVTPPSPGGDAICDIEALSSVSRSLSFRLTVRDNSPYIPTVKIGQTQFTDMNVTVTDAAGPFTVTAPNTPVTVTGGSQLIVTWNVANTAAAPVSTANVKISLSVDGGNTFPAVLVNSTANDGLEAVTVPNLSVSTARIKVEAIGNIFFDIADTNFTIAAVPSRFTVVALTGQHAPGTESGVIFTSFNSDFPPRLNATGACAFHAHLTGPGVDINNNQGIWSGAPGAVTLVARTGSGSFSNFLFGKSAINGAGMSAFWAGVPGKSIWLGDPGNVRLVARVGDQVPGQDPGVHYRDLLIQDIFPPTLNGAGQTVFQAIVFNPNPNPNTAFYGLWVATPDGIAMLAKSGDRAPGTPPETNFWDNNFAIWYPINAAGQSMFQAMLVCEDGPGGKDDCGVREENNHGLWLGAPGSVALLARKGDRAPGTGANYLALGPSTINAAGQTTFPGSVSGPGVTDENDDCLWFGAPGRVTLLAREGEPAPGTPSGVSYGQFVITPNLNSPGETAFIAPISGPGFPGATGVWLGAPGSVRKIFYQGEPAPGAGQGTLFGHPIINGGFCCDAIHGAVGLNDRAEIVFLNQLTGPGVDPANDGSLWFSDVGGGLSLIVRESDLIQVGPDDARVVSDVFFLGGSGDEDGLPCGFNDQSQVAFMARFTDGSEGIFIAQPGPVPTPTPTATPSPTSTPTATPSATAAPLKLLSVASRKNHGDSEIFDVDLPLGGTPGVECRSGGTNGDHILVFTFNNNIISGSASVTAGAGNVSGSPIFDANTMNVNVTGVANAQTITIRVSNVTDTFSQVLPSATVNVRMLLGDVTENGAVNSSDVSQVQFESGHAVSTMNYRADVTVNGEINSSDVSTVQEQSGTARPLHPKRRALVAPR